MMEKGEDLSQKIYSAFAHLDPEVKKIIQEEKDHEEKILALVDQKELAYTGSVVLGLNDALVELTGALTGLTLALANTQIVAVAGLITGVAASLSMAASEYLSTKEEGGKDPLKASLYTGVAYVLAVGVLIFPISVAKDLSFGKRFGEMALISLGVAALNFLIGLGARYLLKIEV